MPQDSVIFWLQDLKNLQDFEIQRIFDFKIQKLSNSSKYGGFPMLRDLEISKASRLRDILALKLRDFALVLRKFHQRC